MSKTIKIVLLFITLIITSTIHSQEFSGVIKYTGVINQKYVDSFLTDLKKKDLPMNIKQGVVDMYINAIPDEYILNIKNKESYFYHNPALDVEGGYIMGSQAGTNSFYTNNGTQSIIEMSPFFGNIAIKPIEWRITSKTKHIGKFKCFQAVSTEKLYSRRGFYYSREVTAWFAPEIPFNYGPKHYKGLPGLILEVDTGKFTLTATQINLNQDVEIDIKGPSKGAEIITQEQMNNRIKEMEEDRAKGN